jgi:hypothetical protein
MHTSPSKRPYRPYQSPEAAPPWPGCGTEVWLVGVPIRPLVGGGRRIDGDWRDLDGGAAERFKEIKYQGTLVSAIQILNRP